MDPLKPFTVSTLAQRAALAGFEVIRKNAEGGDGHSDVVHKFKFWNKNHALELLMRHHRLMGDQPEPPPVHIGPYFGLPEDRRVAVK